MFLFWLNPEAVENQYEYKVPKIIDHEPANTPPPPPGGGFYHIVISGYLDHQSTQFRLSASELLLFVSVVLVLMKCTMSTIWNSKLR